MGRPALGPEMKFQFDDTAQSDAVQQMADDHEVTKSEAVRYLVRYGLAMRAKLGPEWDQWTADVE